MLGDGVVGSLGWVHGQYRSDGRPGRNGPAAGLKRRGAVSLWMWNPEGERGKKEGRERGNGSHRSGRMMGEQSGMPRHPSQKTGERERLLPPVAAAAAPAWVLQLGKAATGRFSF